MRYKAATLVSFCQNVFEHFGVPENEAHQAAQVLNMADLQGIDSHGVARMYAYVELLNAGKINPRPNIKVIRSSASTATVDGDNGLGLVVGPRANQIAIEKAKEVGTGWVSVCNTNHYGMAGYYPHQALKEDMIGWSMTNSTALVAPLWGAERQLGTNPIAIAFPGNEEPPIVIDMATSAVSYGKIELAARAEEAIIQGWAVDADGKATDDPNKMKNGGALLPLGSSRALGGHKGYALAAMVDVLTSILSGANWGPFAPQFTLQTAAPAQQVGKGIGHFFGAMQIEAFRDSQEFKSEIDQWIRCFRATKPAPGTNGPLIPGDPERAAEADRSVNGIPLSDAVLEELSEITKLTKVALT